MWKTLLKIFAVLAICVVGFFYVSFFGLPWKKVTVAKELEQYIEKKYAIDVDVKDRYYNFKDGSYGAIFVETTQQIDFTVEKISNDDILDYYAEAVWVEQVTVDTAPIIEKSFPSFTVKEPYISPVYGIGNDLTVTKDIPNYRDVNTMVSLILRFEETRTKQTEEVLVTELFAFIQALQQVGIENVGITVYLDEEESPERKPKTFSISFEGHDLKNIHSEQQLQKFINIF